MGGGPSAAGRPRLPIRLMSALLYLNHAFNLSDEELVERCYENVVWQYFSGLTYYEPRLPCDATQIGRFRKAIGEAGVDAKEACAGTTGLSPLLRRPLLRKPALSSARLLSLPWGKLNML